MSEQGNLSRLAYIDGLRAVAIFLVVWFHAQLPGVSSGFLGVDIFFVISGFLITGQIFDGLRAGSFSLADFYARRIIRIGPPLLIVILVTLATTCLLQFLPADMRRIALSAVASAAMVSNWYFLNNLDYFAPPAEREPLLHLWSLGVEEQYYLVVPALALGLAAVARRRGVNLYVVGLASAVFALVCSLAAAAAYARSKPEHVFFATPLRMWELAIGGTAVMAIRYGLVLSRRMARFGVLIGLVAIAAAATIPAATPVHRFLLEVMATAGSGSVLLSGVFAQGGMAHGFLSLRPMVGLGLVSYSLYLWHWPGVVFWRILNLDAPTRVQNVLAGILVPLLLAVITYVAVERPLRAWRRSSALKATRPRVIAQGLGASVAVAMAGLAVLAWSTRLSGTERFRPYVDAAERILPACPNKSEEASVPACRLGAGPDVRVLLWGDSHGLSISGAVARSAEAAGVGAQLLWQQNCPPVPGGQLHVGTLRYTVCTRQNDSIHRWLSSPASQSVTGIILEGAWEKQLDWVGVGADGVLKLGEVTRQVIGELRALGLRVLVLGAVPVLPYPVPECILRARSDAGLRCRRRRAEVDLAQREIVDALRSATTSFDETRFIDIKRALCDENYCWPGRDGELYYSDNDHLTASGARRVYEDFKDDFAWVFETRTRDKRPAANSAVK